ncbi:hypothetical protein [Embleya sp. NBC_00896]|uniref:hypothetical protein n=1 Tax=Embleya sp. NBC_00896 TaxID=2975961 RepID=UPI0038691224|nr:hypothetical protein OG928_22390 [Embleya sp. NBC_00896]
MNREHDAPARPVTGSRTLAYLRDRLGRRAERVLVVPASARRRPTHAEVRRAGELWWVEVREHAEVTAFDLRTGPDGERAYRVEVQLHWWVYEPRALALRRPVDGLSFVRRDVENRIRKATAVVHGADEGRLQDELDEALADPVQLPECGLSYRPAGVFLQAEEIPADIRASLDRARWAVPLEKERQRLTRTRMEFHRELIREGPEALVAYWLTRFPDQVKAVVDHLDAHPPTESPEVGLSSEVLALLGDADDFERNQLRKAIVAGLAASGPRGMRVLRDLGLPTDLPEGDSGRT